jgi:hypothetical protein
MLKDVARRRSTLMKLNPSPEDDHMAEESSEEKFACLVRFGITWTHALRNDS